MSRDNAYLLDIFEAARAIVEFGKGYDKASFLKDQKTQSAVLHQLLLIGEVVKRLTSEFRQQQGQIPWKKISGMRDKLIHDYDDVDLDGVWLTMNENIPELIKLLEPLLQKRSF